LPRITEKAEAPEGEVAFDATFEVYPEIKLGDLSQAEVERVTTAVTDEAVDKTIEILRKQRRSFQQRPAAEGAAEGDRVTIDFAGSVDGVPFEGGKAEGFQFVIGEGQMLPQFDSAVRGMKAGESKTFPLQQVRRRPAGSRQFGTAIFQRKIPWRIRSSGLSSAADRSSIHAVRRRSQCWRISSCLRLRSVSWRFCQSEPTFVGIGAVEEAPEPRPARLSLR
jgi:FKBP-type peptidyl-prolyl cis-trans isomerase 2